MDLEIITDTASEETADVNSATVTALVLLVFLPEGPDAQNVQNPPIACVRLSFGISGRKSTSIFPGFLVVCHLC